VARSELQGLSPGTSTRDATSTRAASSGTGQGGLGLDYAEPPSRSTVAIRRFSVRDLSGKQLKRLLPEATAEQAAGDAASLFHEWSAAS
jgi:hypothetical protein